MGSLIQKQAFYHLINASPMTTATTSLDRTELIRIFREILPNIRASVRKYISNQDDIDDLLHDALLKILELNQQQIRNIENPEGFLYTVVKNLSIDNNKKAANNISSNNIALESLTSATTEPDKLLHSRQDMQILKQALSELPQKCRQAFVLHRFKNMPQKAVAEEMGLSLNSIERYIMKAHLHCLVKLRGQVH